MSVDSDPLSQLPSASSAKDRTKMSEIQKIIRVKRRSTPQEDFSPVAEETPEETPALKTKLSTNHPDNLTVLDIFALMALPGFTRRFESHEQIARESYKVAHEMYKLYEQHLAQRS